MKTSDLCEWVEFPSRAEWLKGREEGIGASDAAAVMGVSHWSSPYQLWLEKSGLTDERATDEHMAAGTEYEGAIAAAYTRKTGRSLWRPSTPGFFRRLDLPFLRSSGDGISFAANPDFGRPDPERPGIHSHDIFVGPVSCVEMKCVTLWGEKNWANGVPLAYQVQAQHEMLVTGLPRAEIVAFFGTRFHTEVYDVPRDEKFLATLTKRCLAFWRMVQDGTPPDPDASERTRRAVQQRCAWVGTERKSEELPADLAAGVARMKHVDALLAELEEERNLIHSRTLEWLAGQSASVGLIRGTPRCKVTKSGKLTIL